MTDEIVCVIGPERRRQVDAAQGHRRAAATEIAGASPCSGRDIAGLPPREIARLALPTCRRSSTSSRPSRCARTWRSAATSTARQRCRASRACWRASRCWRQASAHAARTLSGGERQMLAMAMALMVEPARAAARRAVGRPLAGRRRAPVRRHCCDPSRTASPWRSWSRTPTRLSPSPTAPTCWSTASNSRTGAAKPWPPTRRSERLFLGA